jgi:hypothetical protein
MQGVDGDPGRWRGVLFDPCSKQRMSGQFVLILRDQETGTLRRSTIAAPCFPLYTPINAAFPTGTSNTPSNVKWTSTTRSTTTRWTGCVPLIPFIKASSAHIFSLSFTPLQDGRPIYIERLGKLDVAKLYALTTQERQLQHLVSEYEKFLRDRLPACSDATGHLVETSCTIMDLHNVGLSSFYRVKDYVSAASAIGQNYCECR